MKNGTKMTLFAALVAIVVAILSIFKLGMTTNSKNDGDKFI